MGDAGLDRAADVLRGGPGNDQLLAWSAGGQEDRISCGDGTDTVSADKGIDRVAQDCERVFYRPG
jgi:hypothetical protein